jgi:hypothetical protein
MPSLAFSRNATNKESALIVTVAITGSTPGVNYTILGAESIDPIAKRFQINFPPDILEIEVSVEPTASLTAPEQLRVTVLATTDGNRVNAEHPSVEPTLQPLTGSTATAALTVDPATGAEGNDLNYVFAFFEFEEIGD